MRFKFRTTRAIITVLAGISCGSCGVLGNRADINRLLAYDPEAVGCMNEIGPRMASYFKGDIESAKWQATWDCAVNSIGLFKKFVKTSDPAGFTRDDIRAFVSKFLLTNQKITPELVAATFELKASIFGGSKTVITAAELDRVVEFLQVGKTESTRLLPFLVLRAREPTTEHLLALADSLVAAGDGLAAGLVTDGNSTFSWSSAQTFANELAKIGHLNLPADAIAWVSSLKVLLTAGAHDGIEAAAWPRVFRAAVSYGGPAIAAFSIEPKYLIGPNALGEFGMKLAWKVKTSLEQTLDLYGGALPLTALDQVIDTLPENWITIDRTAIKKALRPIARKILLSRVPDAIDRSAIDLIFNKLDFWNRGQTHLEIIYERLGADSSGVTPDRFAEVAARYADEVEIGHKTEVNRLILLARQVRPLFFGNDNQITFTPTQTHSLHNLSQFHWMRLLAEHLLYCYSSTPTRNLGTVDDLKKILDDFSDLGRAFHVIDPSVPDLHIKRFREANLFTFASNGDTFIDLDEGMYYFAFLFSAASLSDRIRVGTDAVCPAHGQDILGSNWKDPDCFRREYFNNFRIYWDHFPLLVRFYDGLSDEKKLAFQHALEVAARRYGYSNQPVARVDTDGFAGIVQYVEAIFGRFDTNGDQQLDLAEAMNAYPVFMGSLAELGKLDPNGDFILTAVFTYLLKYGSAPKQDFWGIVDLGSWIIQKPFWKIQATRLSLFKVIAAISVPEAVPSGTTLPAPAPHPQTYSWDMALQPDFQLSPPPYPVLFEE